MTDACQSSYSENGQKAGPLGEFIWLDLLIMFLKGEYIKAIVWYPMRTILGNARWITVLRGPVASDHLKICKNAIALFLWRIQFATKWTFII